MPAFGANLIIGGAPMRVAGRGLPAWVSGSNLAWDFSPIARFYGGAPSFTDTHAQTIHARNAADVFAPFAANVLPLTDLGAQTVPSRTNSLRNNSMVGAVVGTPGTLPTTWPGNLLAGLTQTVVGFGTVNGIPYIDIRFAGTTNSTSIQIRLDNSVVPVVNGQVWTLSASLARVAGSFAGISGMGFFANIYNSVPAYLNDASGAAMSPLGLATTTLTRFSRGLTVNHASAALARPYLNFDCTNGAAVDFTIRIAAPQFELGNFSSPPILTTAAAVTVNGNQPVVAGLVASLANGVAGLVQVDVRGLSASSARILCFSDGTINNQLALSVTSTQIRVEIFEEDAGAPVSQGIVQGMANPLIGVHTIAFAFSSNFFTCRVVGQANPTPDTVATYPVGLDRLALGGTGFNLTSNGFQSIRKLAVKFGAQDAASFAAMFAKAEAI